MDRGPFLAGLAPGARSRFWEHVGWGPEGVNVDGAGLTGAGQIWFGGSSSPEDGGTRISA